MWNNFYRPHPKDGKGNVFSLFTPGGGGGGEGGYPYSIMLCNISQNAMGQPGGGGTLPGPAGGGGYPARSSRGGDPGRGGTLAGGVPWLGAYPGRGGTLAGGVPWPGGYPGWGGTLAGEGVPCRGGTQLGQHREYLLHGGRYASCVHAGGLSCLT